ncbi:serine/threonine-protein kinase Tor-like isoform X5 [Zingiber officinale]|uniref:serine/threonine-protein kinase Tor-like isoform X5 n=1 Tax=Zingiber officinale TaxID=94328 RepID=UPI001C4D1461|nr:serine/threonine-protein kinase Tor-like isoform X5 [Zingiber officinale]
MCSSPLGVYPTSLSFWGSDGQRKKKAIARFISLFMLTIANFAPHRIVITSKKRPSKLTIHGSDEEDYAFLLKGHEDLRQDEFVMQVRLDQKSRLRTNILNNEWRYSETPVKQLGYG